MKYYLFVIILLSLCFLNALPVSLDQANQYAQSFIDQNSHRGAYIKSEMIQKKDQYYLITLNPQGFILLSSDTDLPPMIAYSFDNNFSSNADELDKVNGFVSNYLSQMIQYQSASQKAKHQAQWQQSYTRNRFDQWPPEGSTTTGGWLKTNWTQTAPYNNFCPKDPETNSRSYAGCPSIAMGQIVNFHRTLNGTQLNENDRYHAFFSATNSFFVDDAYEQLDFPQFSEINNYLNEIENLYQGDENLNNNQKAALVFACGIAIKQAYSSSVSGSFFDCQVINGFKRFGFNTSQMLRETDLYVYERIAQNMKNALPAQISLLSPDGSGHQIVVDGYNTNEEYHFNFGWGGSSNGWYAFPLTGMPYNLNIFGSIVVDINQDYENCPNFNIQVLNSQPMNNTLLQYQISNENASDNTYFVYIDDIQINTTSSPGTYYYSVTDFPNRFHTLSVIAYSANNEISVKQVQFEIVRGEIVFEEDFDSDDLSLWQINSQNEAFTWQKINNSMQSFTDFDPQNASSMTCPIAYDTINESMISPVIAIPSSGDIQMTAYIAYSDNYLQYPNVRIQISNTNGTSWQNLWQSVAIGNDWQWHPIQIDLNAYQGQNIQLKFVCSGFSYCAVSVDQVRITNIENLSSEVLPVALSNLSVYPNPLTLSANRSHAKAHIQFELNQMEEVQLAVYDIKGRKVKNIERQIFSKGLHTCEWDQSSDQGKLLPSGVYFVRCQTPSIQLTKKILILH